MNWTVPLVEVGMPEEDVEAVLDCLRSGWLTMGPRTKAFETAFAEWNGSEHALAVSSGSAALHLACLAVGIGPGDEVIVPGLTFIASAHAPRWCGAETVLCDVVSPGSPLLDVADVERRITPRTKAVIAVHFGGYPADMVALRELCDRRGLRLVEDAAQGIGALDAEGRRTGTVGDAGCFSFFSKKQLCVGEGGMVTTADPAVAERVRLLRSHAMTSGTWDRHRGHEDTYDIVDFGFNYRMDEPRAALGLSRLGRLTEEIESRRDTARTYRAQLADVPGIEVLWADAPVERASHFAFGLLLEDVAARQAMRTGLALRGIQTTRYPVLHSLTEYSGHAPMGSLPSAEAAADRHVMLPIWAGMPDERVEEVIAGVRAVAAEKAA